MTKLETSLLDLLKEDCRIPIEKLAVMTGASLEEVAETIESLEKRLSDAEEKVRRLNRWRWGVVIALILTILVFIFK